MENRNSSGRSDRPSRPSRDGEFKPRRPREDSQRSGTRNNSAFKPKNERFGDRSLKNRRKDDHRPVNRDFSKDPIIPEGITGEELDKVTRGDLLTLSADNAKIVAQHLSCVNAYADSEPELAHEDRKSTRLNSSHIPLSRMPSSA